MPDFGVALQAELPAVFTTLALRRGLDPEDAEGLLALVPEAVRSAPCILDKVRSEWMYDFGSPTRDVPAIGSGITFHPVHRLVDVLAVARERLTKHELQDCLLRLGNPMKHRPTLFEFSPVLRLPKTTRIAYEVSGEGVGNSTIDWKLSAVGQVPVLLEVKERLGDLVRMFEGVRDGRFDEHGVPLPPDHDTGLLFASVEKKFRHREPHVVIQGAWIGTHVIQNRTGIERSFAQLDSGKVHFAVLGGWTSEAYLLARDDHVRSVVTDVLLFEHSERLVFDGGVPG